MLSLVGLSVMPRCIVLATECRRCRQFVAGDFDATWTRQSLIVHTGVEVDGDKLLPGDILSLV